MRKSLLAALFLSTLAGCSGEPSGTPANTAPVVTLVSPAPGLSFAGGDTLRVVLQATDAEQGALGASRLSWWVTLHHATHTHPFVAATQGAGGFAVVPRVGHPETDIFYRVYARAVDDDGVVDTAFVDIVPQLTSITLLTSPASLNVTVDGQPRAAPVVVGSVVGMDREIGAPSPQQRGDSLLAFTAWSDGGAATHTLRATASAMTLTAAFVATATANVAPAVTLSAPGVGATVTEGIAVTLLATATDGDGVVARVQFLVGPDVIGEDLSPPFTFDWVPSGLGVRSLAARAIDDDGAFTLSRPAWP